MAQWDVASSMAPMPLGSKPRQPAPGRLHLCPGVQVVKRFRFRSTSGSHLTNRRRQARRSRQASIHQATRPGHRQDPTRSLRVAVRPAQAGPCAVGCTCTPVPESFTTSLLQETSRARLIASHPVLPGPVSIPRRLVLSVGQANPPGCPSGSPLSNWPTRIGAVPVRQGQAGPASREGHLGFPLR